MTSQDFITKWGTPGGVPGPAHALNEEQGAQSHFLDLCELLDVPKPGSVDGYRFEEKSNVVVAAAYGWSDYTLAMPDDEILKRLLALNLERAKVA